MFRNRSAIFIVVLIVALLLLPSAGCITVVRQGGDQPATDQSGNMAPPQQQSGSQSGNQPGSVPSSGQSSQANQSGQQNQPPPTNSSTTSGQQQSTSAVNWTGTWQCGQFNMYLSQLGNQVKGWWEVNNTTFDGFATGTTLVGTWKTASSSGDFQMNVSSDGKTLNGFYRVGTSGNWTGQWTNCARISTTAPSVQPPVPSQQQPTSTVNWTGTWQCGNYKMYLTQTGNQVTGWYEYKNWKIEGFATGTTLVGTWTESATNFGDFQITMSSGGNSMTGVFRTGSSGGWTGSWSCTRTSTATPPSQPSSSQQSAPLANWTGTWQCFGQTYFTQTGNQVTGWKSDSSDRFAGYATGNLMVGDWTDSTGQKKEFQYTMSSDGNSYQSIWKQPSGWSPGATGCQRTSSNPPPAPPPVIAVTNWSGQWLCGQWGRLTLSQTGSQVTGTYPHDSGKLIGYATGNTLVGTWSESPSYSPPSDAGDIQFTMSSDGQSFTGVWRYGSSGSWAGSWNGSKDT